MKKLILALIIIVSSIAVKAQKVDLLPDVYYVKIKDTITLNSQNEAVSRLISSKFSKSIIRSSSYTQVQKGMLKLCYVFIFYKTAEPALLKEFNK